MSVGDAPTPFSLSGFGGNATFSSDHKAIDSSNMKPIDGLGQYSIPLSPPQTLLGTNSEQGSRGNSPLNLSSIKVKQEAGAEGYPTFAGVNGGAANTADLFGFSPANQHHFDDNVASTSQSAFGGSMVFGDADVAAFHGSPAFPTEELPIQPLQTEGQREHARAPFALNTPTMTEPSATSESGSPNMYRPSETPSTSKRDSTSQPRQPSEKLDLQQLKSLPLPAMFGGVKGKGGKKGGGVSSVVLEEGEDAGEDDDWRPSVSIPLSHTRGLITC